MTNVNERETAEFNMAVGYLNRLNMLFYMADEAAMSLKPDTWMHTLMTIYRELSTEMNTNEIDKFQKDFINVNNFVQSTIKHYERTGRMEISPDTYQSLHKIEIELRKVLKSSGLQMKMKQSAFEALE